ncbi:MAG: hypothetical protein WCR55_03205 [Lentisphaerota bacterium]
MIINLTKKTIISNRPNFRLTRILRAGIVPKNSFLTSDCLVLQNCKIALNFSKLNNMEVIFVDSSNAVCKILSDSSKINVFLRAPRSVSMLVLPHGATESSLTQVGDLIDLSAELTSQTRKSLSYLVNDIIIPVPDTAMMKATKE